MTGREYWLSPRVTVKAMTPSGVFGDVRLVSAEKGQKIADLAVEGLKKIVLDLYQVQ